MSQAVLGEVLDGVLNRIVTSASRLTVCSAQPTSYTEASTTYKLADIGIDAGDLTIADGDSSGRKLTVAQQTSVLVDSSGTANHVAILDDTNQRLLLVTAIDPAAVTAGANATVLAFDLEISGNVLPSPSTPPPTVVGYPLPGMYLGSLMQQAWLNEEEAYMAPLTYKTFLTFCGDGWDNAMAPGWVTGHWSTLLDNNPGTALMMTFAAPPYGLDTGWPQAIEEYYQHFTDIINGVHDGKAYQLADNLINAGLHLDDKCWLSMNHEANGDWYRWNVGFAGSPERWAAAWQRFASKIRERLDSQAPGHTVKIGWCGVIGGSIFFDGVRCTWVRMADELGKYHATNNPGGFDFLAFDNYGAAWGQNWSGDVLFDSQKRLHGAGNLDYVDYCRDNDIPLTVNEWGPWGLGGEWGGSFDDPIWVRRFFEHIIRSGVVVKWHQWNVVGPESGSSQLGVDSPYPLSKVEYKTQALALYHEHH